MLPTGNTIEEHRMIKDQSVLDSSSTRTQRTPNRANLLERLCSKVTHIRVLVVFLHLQNRYDFLSDQLLAFGRLAKGSGEHFQ